MNSPAALFLRIGQQLKFSVFVQRSTQNRKAQHKTTASGKSALFLPPEGQGGEGEAEAERQLGGEKGGGRRSVDGGVGEAVAGFRLGFRTGRWRGQHRGERRGPDRLGIWRRRRIDKPGIYTSDFQNYFLFLTRYFWYFLTNILKVIRNDKKYLFYIILMI